MDHNYSGRQVKISTLMRAAAFRRGFDDKRAGKPFAEIAETKDQWAYERGRLLACLYAGPLKSGRDINREALSAFGRACSDRSVI